MIVYKIMVEVEVEAMDMAQAMDNVDSLCKVRPNMNSYVFITNLISLRLVSVIEVPKLEEKVKT